MNRTRTAAFRLMILAAACLAAGCGDDSTDPDDNEPAPGAHLWSACFGDAQQQSGTAVAVDAAGNVIVTGHFSGSLDLGGGPLTSAGALDLYVAKLGADGAHVWSRRFGDAGDQSYPVVAVDAAGGVVVAGALEGTIDFGGGALAEAGNGDAFVARFTSAGAHVWSRRFGNDDFQRVYSVAVGVSGNVIIAGLLRGTADFGGGTLTSAGGNDAFVVEFDANGVHAWSRRFGDAGNQYASAVAVDDAGNVIVAGDFQGSANFGGGALTSAGDFDIFMARYGPAGNHLWSARFGDASAQKAGSVAVDATGEIVLVGPFTGQVGFGGAQLACAGSWDAYIARLAAAGTHVWSARFGNADDQKFTSVAVDPSGNVAVTGRFSGTVDCGGGALTSAGGDDGLVARFTSGGAHLWSRRFGDAEDQIGRGIAVDAAGNVIVVSDLNGTADCGGGLLASAGLSDVLVAKFAP